MADIDKHMNVELNRVPFNFIDSELCDDILQGQIFSAVGAESRYFTFSATNRDFH